MDIEDVDMERQVSDAIDLMDELEDIILEAGVSYAAALNACAGVHGKIFTHAMVLAYGLDDQFETIADIVMQELDLLAERIRDKTIMLIKPAEGEPVN